MPRRPRFTARKPGQPSVGRRRASKDAPTLKSQVPAGLCSEDELAELIGSLTGKEVVVGKGRPLEPGPSLPVVASAYRDEDGALVALLLADIGAAAGIAAALTLMSAGTVTEATRKGALDDAMLENWNEIANICTQIIRISGFPKGSLSSSTQSADGLGADVEALLEKARYRAGWTIQVPQFASGRLGVVLHRED